MDGVDFQRIRANELGFRSLDNPDRGFLSVGPAAESEDCLRNGFVT